MLKIAIIGPECTGKTSLSQELSKHFNGLWVPEYARDYIENLHRKYNYDDVEKIAQFQYKQIVDVENESHNIVFFDTELIITKKWFEIVFKKEPDWLEEAIRKSNFHVYLICKTDIPWESDNVRENGGAMREILYNMYKNELQKRNFPFFEVEGLGDKRIENALNLINNFRDTYKS